MGEKEAYVLRTSNEDVDIWLPERQVLISVSLKLKILE
jgi:hypothetical protein